MGLVLRVRSGCVPVVPRPPARSPGRVRARLRCLVRCPGRVAPLSRVPRLAAPGRPARAIIARLCRPAQPCPGRAASAGCVFSQGHVQQKRRFGTAGSLRRGIPRRWRNATWGFFGILREDASDAEWCQTVDFAAYRIRFSFGRDPAPSGVTAAAIGFRRDVAFGSDRPAPNLARPGVTSQVCASWGAGGMMRSKCNIAGKTVQRTR